MINGKIIKVCGMRCGENIKEVEALGVDLIGFIFYSKSARFVYEFPDYLPVNARRVGVFVNEDKATVKMYADRFALEYVQLHGEESPEYCQSLQTYGLNIIKTFPIAQIKDLQPVQLYEGVCAFFLFDTKCKQYGGSGNQFDWKILQVYKGETPFLLSGGIDSESSRALKKFQHPQLAGYDLNSRFETKPGKKNITLIQQFLNEL